MFSENLKISRKAKGLTQDELATQLNVVRQTVSKWEKGLSVPDAEILIKMADIFEVSVSNLLGAKIESENNANDVAEQLSRINEQLAVKNRRTRCIWKIIGYALISIIAFNIILVIFGLVNSSEVDDKDVSKITQSESVVTKDQ